jgi:hypothetical protein
MRNQETANSAAVDNVVDAKPAKRMSASLTAGDGASRSQLTILAMRKADDTATVFVTTTNLSTKKTARGMTKKFDTFALAVAAVHELVHDAVTKGWKRRERSGGFKPRPDAFTTIPTPPASKGKK